MLAPSLEIEGSVAAKKKEIKQKKTKVTKFLFECPRAIRCMREHQFSRFVFFVTFC
jgi:hypothetical protein